MSGVTIPNDAVVFVGDGRKALFLRNEGDEEFPNLVTLRVFIDVNLATHEQGTDRPGRTFKPGSSSRRSRLETADWHDLEEHRFARQVAGALEDLVRARNAKALFIVAPPRTLAELRRALHTDVRSRIHAEINKDLTKLSLAEIEKHLVG